MSEVKVILNTGCRFFNINDFRETFIIKNKRTLPLLEQYIGAVLFYVRID